MATRPKDKDDRARERELSPETENKDNGAMIERGQRANNIGRGRGIKNKEPGRTGGSESEIGRRAEGKSRLSMTRFAPTFPPKIQNDVRPQYERRDDALVPEGAPELRRDVDHALREKERRERTEKESKGGGEKNDPKRRESGEMEGRGQRDGRGIGRDHPVYTVRQRRQETWKSFTERGMSPPPPTPINPMSRETTTVVRRKPMWKKRKGRVTKEETDNAEKQTEGTEKQGTDNASS